ncbi:MAG TPA: alcohol dehydrogenase catalytic domain-containing protein [Acidimicrobiales bacterium]|nr:alcohol dehydrogenase catalytic domain-containing protein [Acidimicrobiales bacterium]
MTDVATLPRSMRAVVHRAPGEVEVAEIDLPQLGEHDVAAKVAYCGVCGTDLHLVFNHGGWGAPGSVYGHEWSGEVVATGDAVTRFAPGDRVVGGERTCGHCRYCRGASPSLCENQVIPSGPVYGAFAEYVVQHEEALVPVGGDLPLRVAALAEPLAVSLHAVTRSNVSAGDRVLVTGGGPIGLLTACALRARGLEDVVVSEPAPARRAKLRSLSLETVEPAELPVPGHLLHVVPGAFDAVIECSGTVAATTQGIGVLRSGGRLVIVGSNFGTVPLDPMRVLVQEIELTGARQYDPAGLATALEILADPAFPSTGILEADDTPFEGFRPLVHAMVAGEIAGKPLVVSA